MPFRDPIVAGTTLVRDAIQSRNFVTGLTGWTINSDGSAEFNNVVIRGTILASDFRSSNYVAGVSGFDLNAITNQIEFNTGVRVGPAAGANVQIGLVAGGIGAPGMTFHTTGSSPAETISGSIEAGVISGFPVVEFDAPTTNNGHSFIQIASSTATVPGPALLGGISFGDNSAVQAPNTALTSVFTLPPYMSARFQSVQGIGAAENALIIGTIGAAQMRFSTTEVQALSNNTTGSLLSLNPFGGNVQVGGSATTPGTVIVGKSNSNNVNMNFNQIWALNNAASATLFLQFSANSIVQIGDGTSTKQGLWVPAQTNIGARDTTARTGFVGATFQNITTIAITGYNCPPSGSIEVTVSAVVTPTAASTANEFILSVQVDNITQATQPHAGSANDAAETCALVAGPIMIQRTFIVPTAGNNGDQLTIQPVMQVTGGTWGCKRVWLTVKSSL